MKPVFLAMMVLALASLLSSCANKLSSVKVDKDILQEENMGYLLLTIDTNISYSKLVINGPGLVHLRGAVFYKGKNYYLVPVEAGQYEITKFYDSSGSYYTLSDSDDPGLWSFEVAPNGISYIGDFKVRSRSSRSSKFLLVNNSSYALEYLEEKYPKILSKRTLSYEGPGEDFFFQLVRPKSQVSNSKSL